MKQREQGKERDEADENPTDVIGFFFFGLTRLPTLVSIGARTGSTANVPAHRHDVVRPLPIVKRGLPTIENVLPSFTRPGSMSGERHSLTKVGTTERLTSHAEVTGRTDEPKTAPHGAS